MTEVADFLEARAEAVDAALERFLADYDGIPDGLREALHYALFPGGKRLRPTLVLGAAETVSGDYTVALPAACALEMIHTYSLVHDDLPCMDDDDIRRGQLTVHRKYNDATGVLVGDALQALAFELLARGGDAEVVREVAQAAGPAGMVGGQYIDLESEGKTLQLELIKQLHRRKTGALIRVSMRVGARLAGATAAQLDALSEYGEHIGLAFQIVDDILDVVGDDDFMGKRSGMDRARKKSTYPALVGLDEARRLADETKERAIQSLDIFGPEADTFRALAQYVVERRR